ncbi:MAG: amidase family protein, partial [Acidimicrobiales bacterium]|nr:amidase family protein [Acidimicrobiales bacterium]
MSSDPQPQILGVRSACELLGMLKSREISSVELLEYFVERNDALHPKINAIVTLDIERAVASAKASDQRRLDDQAAGELDGLPMTIKDAIAVAGVRSTGGAIELEHHVPERDAEVVTKVRDAGAVIFGKTN